MVRSAYAKRPPGNTQSAAGSIREVRLLGEAGAGAGPRRREGGRIEWAGRSYRVAGLQEEPFYLHLEEVERERKPSSRGVALPTF